MSDHEERIRKRAHEIWETEGKPDGQDRQHWERASREIGEPPDDGDAAISDGPEASPHGIGRATPLQPHGTVPGRQPGAGMGSIGTGGGSTAGKKTGNAR
jgi:hypothetical protein